MAKPPDRPLTAPFSDQDPWSDLRRLTAARIGLARSGASLATAPLLEFRLAHARARDAVWAPLDHERLQADLSTLVASLGLPVLTVASAVQDRQEYLLRPDLGRQLAAGAETALAAHADDHYDVAFVITEGLSAPAVQAHAQPVLAGLLPGLRTEGWRIAPLTIVRQGRVAVGDAAAMALRARMVAILIGERPGLSAPDSMGVYLTFEPGPHTTDANRNCISNIRPEGVDYASAARKVAHMLRALRRHQTSGVALKDDSELPLVGTLRSPD
jgi:ethanolamine ammonia-lyase small subunit